MLSIVDFLHSPTRTKHHFNNGWGSNDNGGGSKENNGFSTENIK